MATDAQGSAQEFQNNILYILRKEKRQRLQLNAILPTPKPHRTSSSYYATVKTGAVPIPVRMLVANITHDAAGYCTYARKKISAFPSKKKENQLLVQNFSKATFWFEFETRFPSNCRDRMNNVPLLPGPSRARLDASRRWCFKQCVVSFLETS